MILHRTPAEAVEDEQHDRVGSPSDLRDPLVVDLAEQRRHDARDARALECGEYGIHSQSVGAGHWLPVPATPAAVPTREHGRVKVSTRGDYAARALLSLALRGSERPTSVKEIAERTSLPQPYLEQILLSVKGAGLVRSKRGVGGGYVLAYPPEEITLADIVAAVEGPQLPMSEHPDHCEGHCILQEVWVGVDDESRRVLEHVTLAELVQRTRIGHRDRENEAT
jgi:Rrf2 family iron-sulfur cluster assembly transcriptional regulator